MGVVITRSGNGIKLVSDDRTRFISKPNITIGRGQLGTMQMNTIKFMDGVDVVFILRVSDITTIGNDPPSADMGMMMDQLANLLVPTATIIPAPVVEIAPSNINVAAPIVNVPAPVVNVAPTVQAVVPVVKTTSSINSSASGTIASGTSYACIENTGILGATVKNAQLPVGKKIEFPCCYGELNDAIAYNGTGTVLIITTRR